MFDKNHFPRFMRTLTAMAVLAFSSLTFALDLHDAKSQGLVGETTSGYLEVVSGNGEAAGLVAQINAQRKAEYQRIAAKNGISLADVELLAGKKAVEKTPAGEYIKVGDQWRKK